MKILIVIDSLGSGAQKQKALLAEGFINKGYKVEVSSYNSSEIFFCNGFLFK